MSMGNRDYDPFGNEPYPQLKKSFEDDIRINIPDAKPAEAGATVGTNPKRLLLVGAILLVSVIGGSLIYYQISNKKEMSDIRAQISVQTKEVLEIPSVVEKKTQPTLNSEELSFEKELSSVIQRLNAFQEKANFNVDESKNFAGLISALRDEKGRASSLYSIGVLLIDKGISESKDVPLGIKVMELAVEKGSASAMNRLGVLNVKGIYKKRDAEKAEEYFRLAAKQGDKKALANLNRVAEGYLSGQNGFQSNKEKAIELLRFCASYGDEPSKKRLEELVN